MLKVWCPSRRTVYEMTTREDLSPEDLRNLREAYESLQWSLEEICDRFAFSPGGLRQFCHRREWKRPREFYRKGVDRKEIPLPRRETAKLLWDSGENCERIGRWIGVSENTARVLCAREFGFRNLRLNKQTYFMRRNLEIVALYELGSSVEELADQFWLGLRSVEDIIRKSTRVESNSLYKELAADELMELACEKHERVVKTSISTVCEHQSVPGQYILWPTRHKQPISNARGISMYLVHVEASYSLIHTGILFGRDRTTVAHACALVEDRRDDKLFDNAMNFMAERFLSGIRSSA